MKRTNYLLKLCLIIAGIMIFMIPTCAFAADDCVHTSDKVEFSWDKDNTCWVDFVCTVCQQEVTVAAEVEKSGEAASCTEDGYYVYSASVILGDNVFMDEKLVETEAKGHAFSNGKCKVCGSIKLGTPEIQSCKADGDSIVIKWSKVSNANCYKVYRKNGTDGSWESVETTSTTSFTDETVEYGVKYTYRVKALNTEKDASGEYSATKTTMTLKKPSIKVESKGTTKIKVSWEKVAGAEGYLVYRAAEKDGKYSQIADVETASYTDGERTTGKKYYYKVTAYSGKYKSKASSVKSGTATLSAPKMGTSYTSDTSSIKIKWEKVSGANGYVIYRKKSDESYTKVGTVSGAGTVSFTDKNAKGLYTYMVKSYITVNGKKVYSERSEEVKARTLKAPKIKVVGDNDDMTNIISWDKVSGANGYEIYYKIGENGEWKKEATVGNVAKYKTDSVKHGKYYYYKVRAIYKSGDAKTRGGFSNVENRIHYYYPKVTLWMSDKTKSDCSVVGVSLENNGVGTIRVYSRNAWLSDRDYYSFDRDLYLIDDDVNAISYVDIAPGEDVLCYFAVEGKGTWYDNKSTVFFDIRYDGMEYRCSASRYYGFTYTLKD